MIEGEHKTIGDGNTACKSSYSHTREACDMPEVKLHSIASVYAHNARLLAMATMNRSRIHRSSWRDLKTAIIQPTESSACGCIACHHPIEAADRLALEGRAIVGQASVTRDP